MLKAKKIRLKPTPEQEVLFWKSAGVSRWAYNYFLSENEKTYREYLDNGKSGTKYISGGDIHKRITALKKTECQWLAEVGGNVAKQAVKDAEQAFRDWLSGKRGKPHFRSRSKSRISFYVNYESLSWQNGGFRGERLGFVRTTEPLPKLPKGKKYSNPHVSYDGKFWYLSVGYPAKKEEVELSGESLGIDLGIKSLAVCSNGRVYKNINKSARMKKLNKRLTREQRRLSRKIENNISGYDAKRKPIFKTPLRDCSNIQRQIAKVRLINKHIADLRSNHLHQTTAEIVKAKPTRIVMETLNVRGMMKNKHLAKAVGEQGFFEFKRQVAYKSEFYGIELMNVPTFYPSSKTCSCCGNVKKNLKLSERVYVCESCGTVIDRDLNAAINLANYQSV